MLIYEENGNDFLKRFVATTGNCVILCMVVGINY